MSITVNLNGSPYTVPNNGDTYAWGSPLTQYLQAISLQMLQKNTPLFTISQDVDFGVNFGLVLQYVKSHNANIASSGIVRLGNGEVLAWRNNANTGNVTVGIGATDEFEINGIPITGIMVIDNLTSFSTTAALSANQGRILNDLIAATGGASGIADVVLRSNIEKTGGDYPIGDQITLSEALVNRVKVSGTLAAPYTSPAVAINIIWDGVAPIAPFILQIYNPALNADTELLYVNTFVNESPAGQFNYVCAALTFSYPITTTVVTNSGLAIGSGSAALDETLINDALNNSYHLTKSRFKVAPFTGDMDWQHRWWNQSFKVLTTTATTIVIEDIAAVVADSTVLVFLSGDKIIFFPKIWNGISYDPVYDSTMASNFKEITLTANGTWSDGTYAQGAITLTHASGDNNHFLSNTDFFVVRKSAHFLYSAGDGTSTNIATEPTVDEFFPVARGNFGFFQDTFDRAAGLTGNDWLISGFAGSWEIVTPGALNMAASTTVNSSGYRTLEDYSLNKLPIEIYLETQRMAGAPEWAIFVAIGGLGGADMNDGLGFRYDNLSGYFEFLQDTVQLATTNPSPGAFALPAASAFVNLRCQLYKNRFRLKYWNVTLGQVEPSLWQMDYTHTGNFNIISNEGRLWLGGYSFSVANLGTDVNYISVSPVDQGFISSGTVTGLTSVSQITGYSRLERNDNKDRPVIFQRDIKVKPD